jgi:hypothetical protein
MQDPDRSHDVIVPTSALAPYWQAGLGPPRADRPLPDGLRAGADRTPAAAVIRALAEGDPKTADEVGPVPLSAYFAGLQAPLRGAAVEHEPATGRAADRRVRGRACSLAARWALSLR